MSTVYTRTRPLPWCARCQRHHVLDAGRLCPVCADDDRRAAAGATPVGGRR